MTSQFLGFPIEVIRLILSLLPVHDLNACRLSCRRLSYAIRQYTELQCRIQSLEHCIEDFSPSSSSTSDLFKNLEELERASLNFGIGMRTPREPLQSFHKFTFFGDPNTSLFLRSGYLIQVRKGEDPGWSYMDLSLKRDLQGYTALDWTGVHLEGREIHGWALDLNQDLMAVSILPNVRARPRGSYESIKSYKSINLAELMGNAISSIQIRLMQFTGPGFANKAVVRLDYLGSRDDLFKTHIEIMGSYLVVLLAHNAASGGSETETETLVIPCRPGTRPRGAPKRALPEEDEESKYQTIYLVHRGSGHVKFKRRVPKDTYFPVLASISEDTFLLARKCDWALELCEITRTDRTMGFRTRRILGLPPVVPRPTGLSVNLKKVDETSSSTCRPSALGCPSTLASGSRPSDSVLAFYVGTFLWEGAGDVQMFYVLKSTLRNLAKRGAAHVWENFGPFSSCMNYLSQCAASQTVAWHQWGPESTRWIHVEKVPKTCSLSGTRCVISKRSGGVRMLDFNPERLHWIKNWIKDKTEAGETGVEDWSVVTSRTTIPAGERFLCDIESRLPYYELRKDEVEGDLFIEDERAVLIRSSRERPDIYGDL